ncbi:hypothetical protein MNV49_000015 [Pseudohyphozyma bogoriensis]|nr:hypothetical protein MNV49_000015 [Pseudohyphozyma bogoriensis]
MSSSSSSKKTKASGPNHGSLTDIVSHLVRSSMGSSTADVPDDQLDRHVAQLLLSEAKEKEKAWGARGSRAYYEEDEPGPVRKPNKRFLSAIIKNVDGHNSALLRAEQEAARKREREERDAADEWRRRDEDDEEGFRDTRQSSQRDVETPAASPEGSRWDSEARDKGKGKLKELADEESREHSSRASSSSRKEDKDTSSRRRRSPSAPVPSVPPPPAPAGPPPSKMDKYFAESYDPRMDVSVDDLTTSSGIIAEGAFDSWDTMLRVVKERKEEKKEREAREKEARHREREAIREERRRKKDRKRGIYSSDDEGPKPPSQTTASKTLVDGYEYVKRGGTREWDSGKVEQLY